MDFSNLNIQPKHKKKLYSLGIKTVDQLLTQLDMPLHIYMRTPESKLVKKFKDIHSFVEEFEEELCYFLTAHKKHLTRVTFVELSHFKVEPLNFFEEDLDETLDNHEIETEDSEDYADYLNLDKMTFPIETLLIGCLPQDNSFVEYETIREVIEPFEETILQSLGTSSLMGEGMETLKKMIKVQGWPSDYPIFVSKKYVKKYPEIVSILKSMATLVIKHT